LTDGKHGVSRKKNSLKGCIFINLSLKIQSHVVKNTPSQTVF